MKHESAQDSASTDFLTGLPNARSICVQMEREIARFRRNNGFFAVLLCDLNGFKNVNDSFGHLVGNKLLQEIARNLKFACREYDQVARLGGDEFVFILPELNEGTVEELKPRLHSAIEEAARTVCRAPVVTASIGCAFYPTDGETAEELLAEADRRMYELKEEHYRKLGAAGRPATGEALLDPTLELVELGRQNESSTS